MITGPATWTKLQDEIPTIAGLAPAEQTALQEAYSALASTFGNTFFIQTHPILQWVWDASAISRRRFLDLHEMLGLTKAGIGVDTLTRKLTQVQEAQKALDLLSWWAGLVRQGCTVEFEPDLPERHGQADLLVRTPQLCYIELTELETSKPRASLQATHNLLQHLIHGYAPPLCFAGRCEHAIPVGEWPALVKDILALRQIATRGALATIERPDGLVLGFAPASPQGRIEVWAKSKCFEIGHVLSPPLPTMEVWRVQRKIQEKAEAQLPVGSAGILGLYSYEVFMQDAAICETLQMLAAEIAQWPQISALALTSLYMHLSEPILTATHEGHRIITRDNGWHRQCTLLLYNRTAKRPLDSTLRARLEGMLTRVTDFSLPYVP